jgi:hypothetical protein
MLSNDTSLERILARVRAFGPGEVWSNDDGTATPRALGWMRSATEHIGGPLEVTTLVSTDSATIGGAFGCNGQDAQASAAVNAAVSGTAGAAYTATEQSMINDLTALVNQLRSALVANGIAS